MGSSPNCRPECTINSECPSNQACMQMKCQDPCPGSCGISALCNVINHIPVCTCPEGYIGDPFTNCYPKPPESMFLYNAFFYNNIYRKTFVEEPPSLKDPCNPSPCGSNALCNNGICTCLPEYQGDPYNGCRPECILNTDCPRDKACIRNKCKDPCPETCGTNAECTVINHIPMCSCLTGYAGNAFVLCSKFEGNNTTSVPTFIRNFTYLFKYRTG